MQEGNLVRQKRRDARVSILSTRGGLFIGPLHPFAKDRWVPVNGVWRPKSKVFVQPRSPFSGRPRRRGGSTIVTPPPVCVSPRRRCRPGLFTRQGRPKAVVLPRSAKGERSVSGPWLGQPGAGQRGGSVAPSGPPRVDAAILRSHEAASTHADVRSPTAVALKPLPPPLGKGKLTARDDGVIGTLSQYQTRSQFLRLGALDDE
jgi:hypothetical protein